MVGIGEGETHSGRGRWWSFWGVRWGGHSCIARRIFEGGDIGKIGDRQENKQGMHGSNIKDERKCEFGKRADYVSKA